jgi:aspartate/methionine/tyrosine aminotransferase
MAYPLNPAVAATITPPIAEAFSWIPAGPGLRPFLNLSQAVPGYPPAEALQRHVASLAGRRDIGFYTDILGIPPLRAALARRMAREGDVEAGDVAITAGGNQAFCLAINAIARPGDNVILPLPVFFNHQMWLEMMGIEVRLLPTAEETAFPHPDAAEALIDRRTRAIVLVTPNNPTGAVYPPELIAAFLDQCAAHGMALVIDETYRDFTGSPAAPHRLFAGPHWRDTFIQLFSFSKSYSMTGYRVGSVIAHPRLVAEVEKLMDCVAICAPHIAQEAALFALEELGDWLAGKVALMGKRLAAIEAALADPRLAYRRVSSGAFFAWVRHPFARPAREAARTLARRHDLLVLPGSMFGPGQERMLRLAFANAAAEAMGEVAERLIESQSGELGESFAR